MLCSTALQCHLSCQSTVQICLSLFWVSIVLLAYLFSHSPIPCCHSYSSIVTHVYIWERKFSDSVLFQYVCYSCITALPSKFYNQLINLHMHTYTTITILNGIFLKLYNNLKEINIIIKFSLLIFESSIFLRLFSFPVGLTVLLFWSNGFHIFHIRFIFKCLIYFLFFSAALLRKIKLHVFMVYILIHLGCFNKIV